MLMLWPGQAHAVAAQLVAILEHHRAFCPPFVHGNIGPSTVLIARSGRYSPGDGASAWLVGPGWDGWSGAADWGGAAEPQAATDLRGAGDATDSDILDSGSAMSESADLRGAGAALAHLTTLGGSRRRPPGELGDTVAALLAGLLPPSPLPQPQPVPVQSSESPLHARLVARFGGGLDSVIRRRPAGSRPSARLARTDSDGVGSAATAGLAARDGGGAGREGVLELELPAGGLRGIFRGFAGKAAYTVLAFAFWAVFLGLAFNAFEQGKAFREGFLPCAVATLYLALMLALPVQAARLMLQRATAAVTSHALVLTRRLGWVRWAVVVIGRGDAGALRLVEGGRGWRVEVEHGARADVRVGPASMRRAEAEWVAALLMARWPELAERAVVVKEG
jgi:hypothetical protein